jgi:Tol biopolymer transport system component
MRRIAVVSCLGVITLSLAGAAGAEELLIASIRTGNSEVVLFDPETGDSRNLSKHPAHDCDPAWSPDGKAIVFVSNREGRWNLFRMDADGGDVKQLTDANAFDLNPAWSPDGKRIAFYRRQGDQATLMVIDADGTNPKELTTDGWDPAWSPDAGRIVFTSLRNGAYRLFVIDPDGGNLSEITRNDNRRGSVHPAYSPDGEVIAYTDQGRNGLEVFICDARGMEPKPLTNLGGVNTFAAWSPDGRRIAFHHWDVAEDRVGSLFVMNADGSDLRPVEALKGALPVDGGRASWKPASSRP